MKKFLFFLPLLVFSNSGFAQKVDTLVDVGGYKLHFVIMQGKGTPILFEAGGGDDAGIWSDLLTPVFNITGTTLITYDRTGFGKSTLDSNKHGLLNGVTGLETALHKLGYNKNIMLVSHSQGAFYTTVYAYRHPDKVKTAVLIDASTGCWFNEKRLAALQQSNDIDKEKFKDTKPGLYYQFTDLTSNVAVINKMSFPLNIPVIDVVSGNPPFNDSVETSDWRQCHKDFVSGSSYRTGITAYGCGHYIFFDNPSLIVNAIVKAYSSTLPDNNQKNMVLTKAIDFATNAANDLKKTETQYRHSENDLNSWGYQLLQRGEMEKALGVFKLNVLLNPQSWNVYDSYAEVLLKNGQKDEAIKMYKKSVELNPDNQNGKKMLEELTK